MNNEELHKITDSIQSKIGQENSSIIADDLGKLFTMNTQAVDTMSKLNNEITSLKDRNEKLVIANGNLLQQVPTSKEEKRQNSEEEETRKSFNFMSVFDEKGHFKK